MVSFRTALNRVDQGSIPWPAATMLECSQVTGSILMTKPTDDLDQRVGRMIAAAESLRRAIVDLPPTSRRYFNRREGKFGKLLSDLIVGTEMALEEHRQELRKQK